MGPQYIVITPSGRKFTFSNMAIAKIYAAAYGGVVDIETVKSTHMSN